MSNQNAAAVTVRSVRRAQAAATVMSTWFAYSLMAGALAEALGVGADGPTQAQLGDASDALEMAGVDGVAADMALYVFAIPKAEPKPTEIGDGRRITALSFGVGVGIGVGPGA